MPAGFWEEDAICSGGARSCSQRTTHLPTRLPARRWPVGALIKCVLHSYGPDL
jgi:hypothetical protein